MGFSVSGSAAILFIAAFVSVGMLYSAAYNGFESVQDADDSHGERVLEQRNTVVNVTNTSYNESGDELLTVNVSNEGSTTLGVNETDLLVDGVYQQRDSYEDWSVAGGNDTDVWLPGETLSITVNVTDPTRVKIVTSPGVTATEVV
jgi:flagellar protein FlaF